MTEPTQITVTEADFDIGQAYLALNENDNSVGGVALFSGRVRDFNDGRDVTGLTLEHYPGMTERQLERIVAQARERWSLGRVLVHHRVGALALGDNIVLVGVTSQHRQAAFDACQFIMDYLKTEAPFWKKERTQDAEVWVEARDSDQVARAKW